MVKKKVGFTVLSLMISLPAVPLAGMGAPIIANAAATTQAGAVSGPVLTSSSLSVHSAAVGDKVTITAQATDPLGVKSVQAVFNMINGTGQIIVDLTYDQSTDTWTGTYTVAPNDADGTWLLSFNMYNNAGTISYTGTSDQLQISNPNGDTTAPVIGTVNITPQPVQAGAPLTISAAVTDNNAVASVTALLYNPSNLLETSIPLTLDAKTGQWTGSYPLDAYAQSGDWTVEIDAKDTAGNVSTDTSHTFTLNNPQSTTTGPTIGAVTLNQTTVQPGDTLTVTTDLTDPSGVSSAVASLVSPDGTQYSYDPAQDPASGQWKVDISIPGTFAPGTWHIGMTAYDNAGYVSTQTSTQTFTVKNNGDYTPPTVSGFQATSANGQISFTANVTDSQSTVASVDVNLTSPSGTSRDVPLTYDQKSGQWVGSYTIQNNDEPGTWTTSVTAQDSAGNAGTTAGQAVTIANANYDGTPPTLDSVKLSATQFNVGDPLTITATAHDDLSGVGTVQAWLVSPSGVNRFVDFTYNAAINQWVGTYTIQQSDEAGTWRLDEVDVTDKAGNTNYDMITSANTYTVTNANPDTTPPTVDTSSISAATAVVGDQVTIDVKAHDDRSGIATASADFTDANQNPVNSVPLTQDPNTGDWTGSFTVASTDTPGQWTMNVYLEDKAGNYTSVPTTNTITIDTTTVHSPSYGVASYYYDNNDFYNAVYYAGDAIKQGDTRPEVQTLMDTAAQKLWDSTTTISLLNAKYAYELLSTTQGVPSAIKASADKALAAIPEYGDAQWYNAQKNDYNAVSLASKAITDGLNNQEVQTFLNTASQSLFDAAATMSINDAENAYQLLSTAQGVPSQNKTDADTKRSAIAKFADAQWYYDQKNDYNAVSLASQSIAGGLSNPEVQTFLNTAVQALLNAATTMSTADAENAYQLLSTATGVSSTDKATADGKLKAIGEYANAQWFNDVQKDYYNAVYYAQKAITDGDTLPEAQTILDSAAQSLLNAAATMSYADAQNAYQLIAASPNVSPTIKSAAQAKIQP